MTLFASVALLNIWIWIKFQVHCLEYPGAVCPCHFDRAQVVVVCGWVGYLMLKLEPVIWNAVNRT